MASTAAMQRLRVMQFSRHERDGIERLLTRKELLDEVNAAASWGALGPSRSTSLKRQQSTINILRPRDVRKVDPSFATRLEPAIIVRAGCIILSLGRILSLVTRDSLYCVLREGRDGLHEGQMALVLATRDNLAALLSAGEAEPGPAPTDSLDNSPNMLRALSDAPPSRLTERSYSDGKLATMVSTAPLAKRHPDTPTANGGSANSFASIASSLAANGAATNAAINGLGPNAVSWAPVGAQGPQCYEFCAMEAVLLTASTELSRRQASLSEALQKALSALRRNVVGTQVVAGARQLEQVRQLKQSVRELLVQSQALEEALRGVLDEDEDMEAMYLTRRHLAVLEPLVEREHEEVEMILESYLQEVGATVAELEVLTYGIEGTEKFVSFRLDSARNRLLKVDVIATATATALGFGQMVSGIFGMNLPLKIFDPDYAGGDTAFVVVAGVTAFIVVLMIVFLLLVFYSPMARWLALCCGGEEIDEQLSFPRVSGGASVHGAAVAGGTNGGNGNGNGGNGNVPATRDSSREPTPLLTRRSVPERSVTPNSMFQVSNVELKVAAAPAAAASAPVL